MKSVFALGIAAATILASPALATTNLIADGSFEGGFGVWTQSISGGGTPAVVIAYGQNGAYPTGAFGESIGANSLVSLSPDAVGKSVAYFSSDTADANTLTQYVNVVAGKTYNIGFDYYAPQNGINNPYDATLSFLVDGGVVGDVLTAGSVLGTPAQTWFNFNTTYLATSTGSVKLDLSFQGLGVTAADFAVDRVYMTAAVPEPSTWAMMIGGLALVGLSMRRSRTTAVSFA